MANTPAASSAPVRRSIGLLSIGLATARIAAALHSGDVIVASDEQRADRFGLSQLYQLRGRVGRGSRRGQVLLLTDPEARIAEATIKRVRALQAFGRLGAGFAISARNLDMRGAGPTAIALRPRPDFSADSAAAGLSTKDGRLLLADRIRFRHRSERRPKAAL